MLRGSARWMMPLLLALAVTALAGERPGDSLMELAERAAGTLDWGELAYEGDMIGAPSALVVPRSDWATVSLTRGRVVLLEGAREVHLPGETTLDTGQIVGTGALSSAVLAVSTAEVTLHPQSALRLEACVESGGAERVLLDLLYGRVRVVIENVLKDGEEFRLSGPTAVALVRGTDFEVAVPRPGVTTVAVHRGAVEVTPTFGGRPRGEPVLLEAGRGVVIGEYDLRSGELPPPPTPLFPDDGRELAFAPRGARRVELRWETTESTARTRLQLAQDVDFETLLHDELVPAVGSRAVELPPGEYHWRLAAEDGFGLAGDFGPARRFAVVIDDVPPRLRIEGWELGAGGRTLTLWGRTEDAAHLVVGSQPVPLGPDGDFRATVPTERYDGSIPLLARDAVGNSAEYRLVFKVPRLPLGLTGPGGTTGLGGLHSARSLGPWESRGVLGVRLDSPADPGRDGRSSQAAFALALGLGGWGEFAVEAPYISVVGDDGVLKAGMGDLLLSARLTPPTSGDFAYALYGGLLLPTADDELRTTRADGSVVPTVGVALQQELNPFALLANLDYRLDSQGGPGYGLGGVWAAQDWLSLSLALRGEIRDEPTAGTRLTPGVHLGLGGLELNLHGSFFDDGRFALGLEMILFKL